MSSSRAEGTPPSEVPLLADRYTVEEPLGQGRFTVYRGEDRRLRRKVAIKEVPLAEGHEDAGRVRLRAMREAHAAARLNNPNVVTVYDVIEESGSIWLVMELVDALSLAQLVAGEGPLTHERAAGIGLAVLNALRSAHAEGVVHRDVKPANVLVGRDDHAKLADFGVATIRDESRVTAVGSIVGSPSYMAPEQAMGAEVGPPADLWALGATLYYAVEGNTPFTRDSAIATAAAVVGDEPRPQENPGALSTLIERLLHKDPERRPGTDQVRAMLTAAAGGGPGDTTLVRTAPSPATTVEDDEAVPAVGALPQEAESSTASAAPPTRTTVPRPGTVTGADGDAGGRITTAPYPWRRAPLPAVTVAVVVVLVLAGVGLWAIIRDRGEGGEGEEAAATRPAQEGETTGEPEGDAGGGEPGAGTGSEQSEDDESPETETTAASPTATSEPSSEPGGGVPEGWTRHEDPTTGYVIAYPEGWRVEPVGGPRVDFRDPETGSYLRVDWTDQPKDDPVADWRTQAQSFASRRDGYQELRISPYEYRDYNAAMWEFRYSADGAQLHVGNLGFVTGGRGYALLFQTREDRWDESQDIYARFRESFRPA